MRPEEEPERLVDELRRALVAAGVKPHDLTPRPDQHERAEAVLADILSRPRPESQPRRQPTSTRWPLKRTRWLATAAVWICVLLIIWSGQTPQPAQASTPPLLQFAGQELGALPASGADAGPILEELAVKAAQQPAAADDPVQHVVLSAWWASTEELEDGDVNSTLDSVERESFFDADGTMRVTERRGAAFDQDGRINVASKAGGVLTDETFVSSDPGPGYAAALPTDPRALRSELVSRQDPVSCRNASGACMLGDVVDLFHNYVVPPALTASLWRVLSADPTITYLGPVRDRLDRPACAFSTPGADGVSQKLLLLDPNTGTYLGEEEVLIAPSALFDFDPPAVTSFSALVHSERIPRG